MMENINTATTENTRYSINISIDPIQKLKEITEQEIRKLKNEKRQMESVHSNLDLLLKRYDLEKSYFGQISSWYGEKPWWVKILLFILSAGVAAGIGFLCHIPIILVLITSGLHIFFSFFFINHYTIHQKQIKRLCEDIIELEKSLTVTINHFNELSQSLNNILINLHLLNTQILNDTQFFQENIDCLNTQVSKYKSIISEIEQSKQSIIDTTSKVQQNLIAGDKKYTECCAIIEQKSLQIDAICTGLDSSNKAFKVDANAMQIILDQYKQATDKIEILLREIESRKKQVPIPETGHKNTEAPNQEKFSEENSHKSYEESQPKILRKTKIISQNNLFFDSGHNSPEVISNDIQEENININNQEILAEAKNSRIKSREVLQKLQARCEQAGLSLDLKLQNLCSNQEPFMFKKN